MTAAIWALMVALALWAGNGSEAGVTDSAGHPTVLICDLTTCVGYALIDGHIVELPE